MKTLVIAGGVLTLLLGGCGDEAISRAEDALRGTLKDPGSAQFKDVKRCGNGTMIRGSVNARNSYGGYTGYTDFYSDGNIASMGESGDVDNYIALLHRCTAEITASVPKKHN